MTESYMKYPNHKAKIIIVDPSNDLLETAIEQSIPDKKMARKDETLYYYLKLPILKSEGLYLDFLKEFVSMNYNMDFFDRNSLSLVFRNNEFPFSCSQLRELNSIFGSIVVPDGRNTELCQESYISTSELNTDKFKTSLKYESISLVESINKRKHHEMISELHNWKKNFFISISLGHHMIDDNYRASFDDETLVDITEVNSIWQLTTGYMFTNKLGAIANLGIMSSKEQTTVSEGTSVSGTGNGVGIVKIGLGARFMPLAKKNWSIYTDIEGGFLNATAKGGSGTVTFSNGTITDTRDISEDKERSNYWAGTLGANYRLGRSVFISSSFQFTSSNFKSDIGSIKGFTGYTINLGIGLSF